MSVGLRSLSGSMSAMDVIGELERLQAEQAAGLAQRTQALQQSAGAAEGAYTQAAAQPPPQLDAMSAFLPALFGNIASVISQNPSYRENAQQTVQQRRGDLLLSRQQNLQALRDVYSQKADEAQRAGDLETVEKYRGKFETLGKTLELINSQMDRDAAQKRAETAANAKEDSIIKLSPGGLKIAAKLYSETAQLPQRSSPAIIGQIIDEAGRLYPDANLAANKADYTTNTQSLAVLRKAYDAATAFGNTAKLNAKVMLNAMSKIKDTGVPWLNQPIRTVDRRGLGSAEQTAFDVARQTVIPEFARLLSSPNAGYVLSDAARKEVDAVVRGDATMNQMIAAIQTLQLDSENKRVSYQGQIDEVRGRISGAPSRAAALNATPAAPDTTSQRTVLMVDKNGKRKRNVPMGSVKEAVSRGWKRVSE